MCDISVAVMAVSAVVSAVGQYAKYKSESEAQKSAAEYNASIAAQEQATQQQLAQN